MNDLTTKECLIKLTEELTRLLGQIEEQVLNAEEMSELTVRQIYYLDLIKEFENPTASELAQKLGVTKPTVTNTLNYLIEKGFVEKIRSDVDRRVYHLHLTDQGYKITELHDEAHKEFVSILTESLNSQEIDQFINIFTKILNN